MNAIPIFITGLGLLRFGMRYGRKSDLFISAVTFTVLGLILGLAAWKTTQPTQLQRNDCNLVSTCAAGEARS